MAVTVGSSLHDIVSAELSRSLVAAFGPAVGTVDPNLSTGKNNPGDYQSSVAMTLAKQLKLPPKDVAQQILDKLPLGPVLETASISGQGFLNLHLSQSLLQDKLLLKLMDTSCRLGVQKLSSQRIVVDFSSPNIAKEMHVVRPLLPALCPSASAPPHCT